MGLFLESLRQRLTDRENRALLNYLESAFQGLRGMLNEMLDISRLDAEVVKVHTRTFAARDLLEKLAQEYAPLATQKGLRFRCVIRDTLVFSDPSQLERILRNLLDNALKYTRRGGILLTCRQRGEHVLLQVYDTGRGIPQQRLDEVFLEFTQIGNPERDASQGLGLGLAIVERLTGLLGLFSLRLETGQASAATAIPPENETATALPCLSSGAARSSLWIQRKRPLLACVPAIIVTGDTAPARIREAHDSGFLLLHKPVEPERLKVCINSLAESVPTEREMSDRG